MGISDFLEVPCVHENVPGIPEPRTDILSSLPYKSKPQKHTFRVAYLQIVK